MVHFFNILKIILGLIVNSLVSIIDLGLNPTGIYTLKIVWSDKSISRKILIR